MTLLRKAGFESVQIAAIEGFVPEEEHQESPLDPDLLRGARERYDPPAQWDTPLPPFPEAAPLVYRPVTEGLLARLRAEEAEDQVPAQALRAVSELLQAQGQRDLPAVLGFALEVREYLLVEGRVDLIVELAGVVRALARRGDRRRPPRSSRPGSTRARSGRSSRRSAPDASEPEARLAELLDAAPAAIVDRLFDLLAAEGDGPRAPLLRAAAGAGLPARAAGARDAARTGRRERPPWPSSACSRRSIRRPRTTSAVEATTGGEALLQREALRHLGAVPFTPEVARALHHLVESAPRERASRGAARDGRARRAARLRGAAGPRRQARRAAHHGRGRGGRPGARALVGAARPSRRSRPGCTRRAEGCSASW